MGGALGSAVTVPAVVSFLHRRPEAVVLLVGDQAALREQLKGADIGALEERIQVQHTNLSVWDDETPSSVLKNKRNSSMGLAIQAVAEGKAEACLSAGNTGALMALGLIFLKTFPGVSRPAICTTFPTVTGKTYVLDLGANVECTAEQLYQFAVMASATAKLVDQIEAPSVRLLNIGEEGAKGGEVVKRASALLADDKKINYSGFIEGDGIFQGYADVVVCDGFSGNIALKTSEGFARMIGNILEGAVSRNVIARLVFGFFKRSFKHLRSHLDPSLYNGAYFLGLNGVVIKSHGNVSEEAFGHALDVAFQAATHNLPQALAPLLESQLKSNIREERGDDI
jgi:glycerol-3-phosphate acyltransferase PlsX